MTHETSPNSDPQTDSAPLATGQVRWLEDPDASAPIVVVALEGLFDIAEAATGAVRHLIEDCDEPRHIASIDPEVFFDFTQARPTVRLEDDGTRTIDWPANAVHELTIASVNGTRGGAASESVIAIAGVEPHLRWRTFSAAIAEIATRVGARLVVTLGAMAGLAPHTRPLGVIGSASDPELADHLGLNRPTYQGPTGLAGALQVHLHDAGLAVISLRVSVPHYVTQAPNPEATRSLLARLELVTGIATGHESYADAARTWRQRVDAAVAGDEDMGRYVSELEAQVDSTPDLFPTGDAIAAQLAAWLRDNG